ncbi:hypothetical protein KIPB_004154 [Kipferlia bialata]|uniref:Uncharacterized protein n=1 Tax=Kipferlia bialata TaxID=797122 RepID=A0A391NI69_9EUKA|nr:hypothetical protein KIPB_000608 [Kipferlia bialata]GCA62536.1 hypothetical protein KIPB_004154 [Kipferlia bialata]|eukprot:g608.t1
MWAFTGLVFKRQADTTGWKVFYVCTLVFTMPAFIQKQLAAHQSRTQDQKRVDVTEVTSKREGVDTPSEREAERERESTDDEDADPDPSPIPNECLIGDCICLDEADIK